MIERVMGLVVRFPKLTLAAIGLATLFFGWHIREVQFENAVEDFFIQGDPDRQFFVEIKKYFGHDGVTVVAMVSPPGEDIFHPDRIDKLRALTDELGQIEGVRRVLSLANVKKIFGRDMTIYVKDLIPATPSNPVEWERLKSDLADNRLYERNLVSADRRTVAINVFIEDFDKDGRRYREIMDQVTAVLAKHPGPEQFYVSGITATSTAIHRAIIGDLSRFIPYSLGLIVIILSLSFRSLRGVLLPLTTVVIATVWTVGFMGLAAIPIGMVTMVLPPQIIAIGNAYTIYIFSEYLDEVGHGGTSRDIVTGTLKKGALPLVLCAMTTVIGFGSLLVNDIQSLKNMGLASVVGVSFAVVLALTAIPALLVLLPPMARRQTDPDPAESKPGLMQQFIASLAEFNLRRRIAILVVAGLVALVGAIGMFRIEFNTDFLSFFGKNDPVSVANEAQQKYLAGAAPFFVVLDEGHPDAFKDPALLRRIELFQNWMTANVVGIDLTVSIVDYIKLINKVFHENDPGSFILPDSKKGVAQLLLFYSFSGDSDDFAPYINGDYSMANITVRSRIVGSSATNQAIARIEEYAKEWFGDDVKVKVTGTIPLINKSAVAVASGQMESLALSLVLILIVMTILFMSFKVGTIAMVPNIMPILVLFGFMGYAGITINLSTALISTIALGLVVDDTIHIMNRYNDELKRTLDPDNAMRQTMQAMTKPAIFTSLSLFFGFAIMGGSDFIPIQQFGLLTAGTVLVAVLGDQVLLPALLSTVRVTTLWDYVAVSVGGSLKTPIRVFAGLSPHQEKIAVLMGMFGFHAPGEEIIKAGDLVKDLFVVLSGSVKSVATDREDQPATLVSAGGDFGACPGEDARPSPVTWVAAESTKVLVINNMTLARLAVAYPNIGKTIINNIEAISASRMRG